MSLLDLFPDEDYRLQMRFERGSVAGFFAPSEHHAELISARRNWLRSAPRTYAALSPNGIPLLEETTEMARNWQADIESAASPKKTPWQRCLSLGKALEPDFLLLKPQADGQFHLWAAAFAFLLHGVWQTRLAGHWISFTGLFRTSNLNLENKFNHVFRS